MTGPLTDQLPFEQLRAAADDALACAHAQGADRTRVVARCSSEQRLVVANKEFALGAAAQTQQIGIVVHKGQKLGAAASNVVRSADLRQSVEDAMALARFSVADPCLLMPDAKQAPVADQLPFLWDQAMSELPLSGLQEFTQAMYARLTRDRRVSIDRLEVSVGSQWRGLYNSLGVAQSESQTLLRWSVMGMALDHDLVSGFDYERRAVFSLDTALDTALLACDRFCERVLGNLRLAKAPAYTGVVLLSPRAAHRLLMDTVWYHLSGHSVVDGKSRWADQLGAQVVSTLLHLSDQPHDARFTGATGFDQDGCPTQPRVLLDGGTLVSHALDCYSANRLGRSSTASGGGPFALVCGAGQTDLAAMKNAQPALLMVDRFSGNIDPLKGDFSGVAKSSRLYRNGEDQGCVSGALIAGNVFHLLEHVLAISSEAENVAGALHMPWMLIDGVTVS
jgi:PmbA protein